MGLLPILLIGAGVYLLNKNKSPSQISKNSDSGNSSEENSISKEAKFIPPEDLPVGKVVKFIPPKSNCNENQYEDNGKCITFWDENTEKLVLDSLIQNSKKVLNSEDSKKLGTVYIDSICEDPPPDKHGNFSINQKALKIIKSTILEKWPMVTASAFPITTKSPPWLIIVWNRVVDIYYKEICKL